MNNLNTELTGKWVVLVRDYFKEGLEPLNNFFFCETGFGTSAKTIGRSIFGHFQDGEETKVSGEDVERLATEEETTKLNVLDNLN